LLQLLLSDCTHRATNPLLPTSRPRPVPPPPSAGQGASAYTLLTNQSAIAALPAALNQANTALLRYVLAGATLAGPPPPPAPDHTPPAAAAAASDALPTIRVTHEPLPVLADEALARVARDASQLMLVLCLTLATAVLSASPAVFLIREAGSGSKHVQLVSGAAPTAFWAAHYTWDGVTHAAVACAMAGLMVWAQAPPLGLALRMLALLLAMGPAGLSVTYALHYLYQVGGAGPWGRGCL